MRIPDDLLNGRQERCGRDLLIFDTGNLTSADDAKRMVQLRLRSLSPRYSTDGTGKASSSAERFEEGYS